MNKQEFAELLDGRQYLSEMTDQENEIAKEHGLLVAFGYSDDGLKFMGIVDEELGAWRGTTVSLWYDVASDELKILYEADFPSIEKFNLKTFEVTAIWSPKDSEASWIIMTDIPCASFDIYEDDRLFCQGIVMEQSDILKAIANK